MMGGFLFAPVPALPEPVKENKSQQTKHTTANAVQAQAIIVARVFSVNG